MVFSFSLHEKSDFLVTYAMFTSSEEQDLTSLLMIGPEHCISGEACHRAGEGGTNPKIVLVFNSEIRQVHDNFQTRFGPFSQKNSR